MRSSGAVVLMLCAASALTSALTGCAVAPEEDPVQIKLNEIDGRVQRIERANQGMVEVAQRMEAMQSELRTLRGRIEELENGTEALRRQQRDLYSDLDKRLAAASTSGSPGAPGGEQAAYTQSFDALKSANYPAAIAGFRQFLESYPNSDLGDNAQYWLGEAYYVTRDYQNAAQAFRLVGERWPDSRKAADALVKLGYTQAEMKQVGEARETLTQVTQRYPDTEAARLAADRLKRLPNPR